MSGLTMFRKRRCVFGCDVLVVHGVPLHRFPHPNKKPELFAAWLSAAVFVSLFASNTCLKLSSLDVTYQKGVQAYKGERWSECIVQFEEALHLYKLYKTIIINCRFKCSSQQYTTEVKDNIEDLQMYEKFFNIRDCLKNCQEQGFDHVRMKSDIEDSVLHNMQARKPYEYLHVCYFQMNALPKAASSAYTYLVAHPDDDTMTHNLKYYSEQPEVDVNDIVDFQSEDFMVLYNLGVKAYNNHKWGETIASMEEAISNYLSWENSCRVECERQPEQEWSPEFVITVSNNIASLLHCRQQCQDRLEVLGYNSGIGFLADVLNYLQISYYKLDRYSDAAKAVETYLALLPHDEDMLANKNIYITITDRNAFSQRSDVVYYLKRDGYEKKLLALFHQTDGDNNNLNSV